MQESTLVLQDAELKESYFGDQDLSEETLLARVLEAVPGEIPG